MGIEDRDAADALKGTYLYVQKSMLPETDEDEYYFSDLVGLRADLVDGGCLGKVKEVHDFGAGAILEVVGGTAGTVMVPFTRASVPKVDKAKGRVVIDPPVGLLEPAGLEDREEE
jgi:16S rRNA processing protein RimM